MTELAEIKRLLANIMAALQEDQHGGTGHAGRQDWCQAAGPQWYDEDCRQQQRAQHDDAEAMCQGLGPQWYEDWRQSLEWRQSLKDWHARRDRPR
jgi:hypothetical protein